jgi:tetratricopeptide (TPR) repeat protein
MPTRNVGLATALLALCLAPAVDALYVLPQLEQVPIERLIRNLTQMADAEPQNAGLRANLARAHAMAFANGGKDVRIVRNQEASGIWFDPEANHVPFGVASSVRDPKNAHLTAAIAAYERSLSIDPVNSITLLGYGWCLVQAGQHARAADAFRLVIAVEWPKERTRRSFMASPGPVTSEAAGYLIPLLDRVKDAEEIARVRGYVSELGQKGRAITPLVIPLTDDGDPSHLVDLSARVRFDADGSGLDREWSWISKDAGWLVYDQRGTRQITSALQLFGNVTFWMFWENGYEALRALDDNGDGKLAGTELTALAIWRDSNSNGTSEAGEVKPLAEWGIVELSCAYESEDEGDLYLASSRAGVTFADGSTRPTYDVLLQRR